jgi:hypothetical protein
MILLLSLLLLLLFHMECKDYTLFIENIPLSKYLKSLAHMTYS